MKGRVDNKTLENLSDDVGSLWHCPQIDTLDAPPSSFLFLRNYVSLSRPCIIRNCIPSQENADEPLVLTLDDLVGICDANGNEPMELTVDVTPDGHGDCVRTVKAENDEKSRRFFVKPEERAMSIKEFRTKLRSGRDRLNEKKFKDGVESSKYDADGLKVFGLSSDLPNATRQQNDNFHKDDSVLYYSRQNDCLRTELRPFFDLNIFPKSFTFAEEAFATGPPDAVNLWIGDERAVSSMHKDHYENLFYVLSGEKIFTLCPPADVPFLHEGEFECGTFRHDGDGSWGIHPDYENGTEDGVHSAKDIQRVKWIEPDIEGSGVSDRYPRLKKAHPIQIRVREGEMLYLPALWYHRVTQSCETVGLNYWFDMRFDSPAWCYFNMLQHMQVDD